MSGVLIVDDHPVVRGGFRRLVEDEAIEPVYEAADIATGYRLFQKHRPDLAVIDLSFEAQDVSGLSLLRRLRALEPNARLLVLSMNDDPVIVARALESGALGYLTKDAPAGVFMEAFATVRAGRNYLEPRVATRVATLDLAGRSHRFGRLNARELQILALLGKGRSYHAIADQLAVSYRTVVATCSSMRTKLGVRTLAELVRIGLSPSLDNDGA